MFSKTKKILLIIIILLTYNSITFYAFGTTNIITSLNNIKQQLRNVNREKQILISREIVLKKKLKDITNNIICNRLKLKKYLVNIKNAKDNLKQYSASYETACYNNLNVIYNTISLIKALNKITLISSSYDKFPIEYIIIIKSLKFNKNILNKINRIKVYNFSELNKWNKEKNINLKLKFLANQNIKKNKCLLKNTINCLKDTINNKSYIDNKIKMLNTYKINLTKTNTNKSLIKINNIRKHHIQLQHSKKKVIPTLSWPTKGRILIKFGKIKHHFLDTYIISNGIKISTSSFSIVRSITHGKVIFAKSCNLYGNMIIIDHGNSLMSIYGCLNKIFVNVGQEVHKNIPIANLGQGHNSVLYFEIRYNNKPVDPLLWLK
jgi:murein DD-endopeptidase MepM/ murein hydrolase activator NlpD